MTSRQRRLFRETLLILAATVMAVVGMVHLKDHVNRTEAVRAMTQLGRRVLDHRRQHGSLPPESFIRDIEGQLEGSERLGHLTYRAARISLHAPEWTVLAYSLKRHPSSFLRDGYVVLRLNGRVEWMSTASFKALLSEQGTPGELEDPKRIKPRG